MKSLYILVIISSLCLISVHCAPFFNFDNDDDWDALFNNIKADCTEKLGCPSGTTTCSKKITTSEDRKTLKNEVKCFGPNDALLKDDVTTEKNPYPSAIQNSYEFFSQYTGGTQTVVTNNHGNAHNVNKNTDVETFDI